jgi:iron complex transport system substrate-binding protein
MARKVYNPLLDDYIELNHVFNSIISLDPGTTETIFMLGLGHLIKATDAFSYRPAEAKKLIKIGSYTHVNKELLDKLNPDIIFTSYGAQKELAKRLWKDGYPVYPIPVPLSVNSILDNVIIIGNVLAQFSRASSLHKELLNYVFRYRSTVPPLKVYIEFDLGGPITIGFPSHINHALEILGARNIFSDSSDSYPIPDDNGLLIKDPDIIIYEPKRLTDYEKERFRRNLINRGLERLLKKKIIFTAGDFLAHVGPSFISGAIPWLSSSLSQGKEEENPSNNGYNNS